MNNKQAIELLKNIYSGTQTNMMQSKSESVQDILLLDCEALEYAIKALEENDDLKAEIERLKESSVQLPCKVGDNVYVLAKCENIAPILDGTLYGESGGFGTATGYYCPYEDDCPHACDDFDCEKFKNKTAIFEDEVNGVIIDEDENVLICTKYCDIISILEEYIFLTREEAEKALKEREVE